MREILFKAKRIDNGEWVEGFYVNYRNVIHYILMREEGILVWREVDVNTLCQYTGLTDKNGNKIWENDIVKDTDIHLLGSVEYDEEHGMYVINEVNDGYQNFQEFWSCTEVIGNIFDNADLMGK